MQGKIKEGCFILVKKRNLLVLLAGKQQQDVVEGRGRPANALCFAIVWSGMVVIAKWQTKHHNKRHMP